MQEYIWAQVVKMTTSKIDEGQVITVSDWCSPKLNDDYTFKKTEEGKNIIAVKNGSDLIQVGFWD